MDLLADAVAGGRGAFLYTRETRDPAHAVHARMFGAGLGVAEDPATGSAAAAFAGVAMEFEKPEDGEHAIVIEQGFEMGRPSLITLGMRVEGGALIARDDRRPRRARVGRDIVAVSAFAVHRVADARLPGRAVRLGSFARERAGEIAAHWARLVAEKPAMFDGRVLLCRSVEIAPDDGGVLRRAISRRRFRPSSPGAISVFPIAPFATASPWRRCARATAPFCSARWARRPPTPASATFPPARRICPMSSDGAVDLAGCVARELHEETGIDIADGAIDPVWTVVHARPAHRLPASVASDRCPPTRSSRASPRRWRGRMRRNSSACVRCGRSPISRR